MSMSDPSEQGSNESIAAIVQRVREIAGLVESPSDAGVVSLDYVIRSYPISTDEVDGLNYRRAAEFLAARVGQALPLPASEETPLAGLLYAYEYAGALYGCILVEQKDLVTRRRFSAAHELGHYVLHFMPLLEDQQHTTAEGALLVVEGLAYTGKDESGPSLPSGEFNLVLNQGSRMRRSTKGVGRMEREANQFAAELLMPAVACGVSAERLGCQYSKRRQALARRLAAEFLVSQEAMMWRLTDLNLP